MTIVEEARQIVNAELDADVAEKLALWQEHVNSVKLKGGPGSGHHGHAGRPGKRGGSTSGGSAYVTIYHGTPFENINSIEATGIKRGRQWFGRPPSVYYLTDKDEALKLADDLVHESRYAIIEARVPLSVLKNAEPDEHAIRDFKTPSAARIETDVDPKWLVSAEVYWRYDEDGELTKYNIGTTTTEHVRTITFKEDYQTIYIIVAFADDSTEEKEFIEKQLPIDQDSKDVLLQLRVDILKDELDSLAEQMFSGDITLNQYHENFKSLIKEARSSAAAIGKGGWDQMGPRDWGRLGTPNREQYKYLQGFVQTIDDRRDTISLEYIKNRGRMYADAIAAATTQAEAGFYFEENLPWLPKDGSTTCLTKCHCYWRLSIVESQKNFNVVEAVWTLGEADHCTASANKDGCTERDGYTEVMRVPKDVEVPAIIGGY